MFNNTYFRIQFSSFIALILIVSFSSDINAQVIDSINPSCELPSEKKFYDLGQKDLKFNIDFNYRRYIKEIFKKVIKEKEYEKKWIKATLSIRNINNEVICEYKSEVRILGDNFDHISTKAPPITSLVVDLKSDSIFGITRFNLFLPATRFGKNELFSSLLYKELGFLSPRTSFITTTINGNHQKYIFQESIEKEFLEFNRKIEGPLYEGDERFGLGEKISFTKLVNPKWSLKNENAYEIILASMAVMNSAYIETSRLINDIFDPPLMINTYAFHPNDLQGRAALEEFYTLTYSINGFLGLSRDDSRFYFNPVFGRFEPIFYDLHPQPNLELQSQKVLPFLKNRIEPLKQKILNINKELFAQKLEDIGADYSYEEMISVFSQIVNNLDRLKSFSEINLSELDKINDLSLITEVQFYDKFGGYLFNSEDKDEWKICNYKLNNCASINLSTDQVYDALRQKLTDKNGKHIIFIGSLDFYQSMKTTSEYPYSIMTWDSYNIDKDSILKVSKGIDVDIQRQEKKLYISLNNELDQAIIYGGALEDWHINISKSNNVSNGLENIRFYKSGLTGCLNIHDIELNNIIIDSSGLDCEDSINLLRVSGNIKEVNINESFSDALDIDFSNLVIKNLNIQKAGNDCVDFSGGNYVLENVNINECGDKGISVGEKSYLSADNIIIVKTSIGLSVKDSSIGDINKINIKDSGLCFALYRKKQEFGSSKLSINESKCLSGDYYLQENSSINFNHKRLE